MVIDGVDAKGFTVNVTPVSDPMSMVPVSVVESGHDVGTVMLRISLQPSSP
ncbi:hypothetical protein PA07A_2246 [Cutibacterium acnes P07A]|nr:hypothetical protein [Cutibacterium acnes P07A]